MMIQIVESFRFEVFCGMAICTSALAIGAETQYMARSNNTTVPVAFTLIQYGCSFAFLVELVIRLIAAGPSFFCSREWAWNYFDTFLVMCSIFEASIELTKHATDSNTDGAPSVSSARLLRILRATRLIRALKLARIIRYIRPLRILIHSIASTLKAVCWALVLLGLIIYCFAILFTQ